VVVSEELVLELLEEEFKELVEVVVGEVRVEEEEDGEL
jgi:hypothetical protein